MTNERHKTDRWPRQYQRVLILYEKGLTHKDIAAQTGYHLTTVTKLINSSKFKARQEELNAKVTELVMEKFTSAAEQAAKKIVDIMRTGSAHKRIQFEAAREILYQIGCKPKTVVEETIKREYTPEEISSALSTLKEIEDITQRLDTSKSDFLVKKDEPEALEDMSNIQELINIPNKEEPVSDESTTASAD